MPHLGKVRSFLWHQKSGVTNISAESVTEQGFPFEAHVLLHLAMLSPPALVSYEARNFCHGVYATVHTLHVKWRCHPLH